jgi:hypothetical protein
LPPASREVPWFAGREELLPPNTETFIRRPIAHLAADGRDRFAREVVNFRARSILLLIPAMIAPKMPP